MEISWKNPSTERWLSIKNPRILNRCCMSICTCITPFSTIFFVYSIMNVQFNFYESHVCVCLYINIEHNIFLWKRYDRYINLSVQNILLFVFKYKYVFFYTVYTPMSEHPASWWFSNISDFLNLKKIIIKKKLLRYEIRESLRSKHESPQYPHAMYVGLSSILILFEKIHLFFY